MHRASLIHHAPIVPTRVLISRLLLLSHDARLHLRPSLEQGMFSVSDVETGKVLYKAGEHTADIRRCGFSPSGMLIAAVSDVRDTVLLVPSFPHCFYSARSGPTFSLGHINSYIN